MPDKILRREFFTMAKVLIVEDDLMIADDLEEVLIEAGYDVCGIATTVAQAIQLGEQHRPDLGVIDLRLRDGEYGTAIAAALCQRGDFGILYVTGNPDHPMLTGATGVGCIGKPYSSWAIVAALKVVSETMAKLPVTSAFPRGFSLLTA
jgi:DNA-binding response OmpR family regulator